MGYTVAYLASDRNFGRVHYLRNANIARKIVLTLIKTLMSNCANSNCIH